MPEILPKEPGFQYGTILPTRFPTDASGKKAGPLQLAVPDMLREPLNAMMSVGNVMTGEAKPSPDLAVRVMSNFLGAGAVVGGAPKNALGTIRGWHGTPHKFEPVEHNPFGEFRDQAIGTGEGAQVYGFGHYVAGNKKTADYYRDMLTDKGAPADITYNGRSLRELAGHEDFWKLPPLERAGLMALGGEVLDDGVNIHDVIDLMGKPGTEVGKRRYDGGGLSETDPVLLNGQVQEWLERNYQSGAIKQVEDTEPPGALLEVLIRPDESELLSWDLPLGRQGDAMKERLKPLLLDYAMPPGGWIDEQHARLAASQFWDEYSQMSGADLYHMLAKNGGDQAASEELARLGIPGIRYWDQGSRASQQWKFSGEQPTDMQKALDLLNTNQLGNENAAEVIESSIKSLEEQLRSLAFSDPKGGLAKSAGEQLEALRKLRPEMLEPIPHTSNYVIFDPKNLHISARNGERLTPVDHDPWGAPGPSKVQK